MTTCRTIDILERARHFHRQLGQFYDDLAHEGQRENVRMLLEYLCAHEKYLDQCLAEYERSASKPILETWFKYVPDKATCRDFAELDFRSDMSVEEVVNLALRMDACLMSLYEQLAVRSLSPELQAALQDLLDLERQEEARVLRNALMP